MPHCTLEYSANVPDRVDFRVFFGELHRLMVETGEIRLNQIKSRWICHQDFMVGAGGADKGFVYLHIAMLSGRSEALRSSLAKSALGLVAQYFPLAQTRLSCSITVEVREINRETHCKLTP